jgi:ribosomal protein L22
MRTIYENYRGFTVSQNEQRYHATNQEVNISHQKLSEVLNTIDKYVDNKSG